MASRSSLESLNSFLILLWIHSSRASSEPSLILVEERHVLAMVILMLSNGCIVSRSDARIKCFSTMEAMHSRIDDPELDRT